MKYNYNQKREQAITLIALIITIIILVILAAVSIRTIVGDRLIYVATNGVRKLCKGAKKRRRNF